MKYLTIAALLGSTSASQFLLADDQTTADMDDSLMFPHMFEETINNESVVNMQKLQAHGLHKEVSGLAQKLQKGESILQSELVTVKMLLGFLDSDDVLSNAEKNRFYLNGMNLLNDLKSTLKKGVTFQSAKKLQGKADKIINEYRAESQHIRVVEADSHPLAGKAFKMYNRWSNAGGWVSFVNDSKAMRAVYKKQKDGAPFKFYPVKDEPNAYYLENLYESSHLHETNHWVSFRGPETNENYWFYSDYAPKSAAPLKFYAQTKNNDGSWKGECFQMKLMYPGYKLHWVSWTGDDRWIAANWTNQKDAMCVELIETKI